MTEGPGVTRSVVERYLAALNAADVDAIAACVTEDFHNEHTSVIGTSVRGRAAYRDRLPEFLSQFRDLRYEPEALIVDGDRAAVPYRMSCTWSDGRADHAVRLRGMFSFRIRDGAICHRVDYWDSADFERQVSGGSS